MLDCVEEQNDISFEMLGKNEVVNSEILNEVADISFENSHENSFQSFVKDRFDNMQEELLFGQPCHEKQVFEYFEICHVFYDPVEEYMDKCLNQNGWLCVCSKDQVSYHNLLPLCSYFLIPIRCGEESKLLDKLLDWAFVLS